MGTKGQASDANDRGRRNPGLGVFSAAVLAALLTATPAAAQQDEGPTADDPTTVDPLADDPTFSADELAEMSLDDLLDVDLEVSTATKSQLRASEAPAITTVITRAHIEERGYRSISDALRDVPGIYIVDDQITANIGVRGLSGGPDSWSRLVKILLDGQALTYYSTGGNLVGRETVPIEIVDRIEVIRGPAAALYGGNAFLGVINIITRRYDSDSATVSAETGVVRKYASAHGAAVFSLQTERLSLVAAASAGRHEYTGLRVPQTSPERDLYGDAPSDNDIRRPRSYWARIAWDSQQFGDFELWGLYQRTDSRSSFSTSSVFSKRHRVVLGNTVLRASHRISLLDDDSLRVNSFVAHTIGETEPDQLLDAGTFDRLVYQQRHNRAWQAGTEASYQLTPETMLLVGTDYLHNSDSGDLVHLVDRSMGLDGDWALRGTSQSSKYDSIGVYGQAIAKPLEQVQLVVGSRYDRNNELGSSLSNRVGVVYKPSEGINLKLLYGSSFVPPAPAQLYAFPIKNPNGIRGNSDLESQTAHTVEFGFGLRYAGTFSAQLTGFGTLVENRVEFADRGGYLEAANLGQSVGVGSELTLQWRRGPVEVRGDLSWQRTELRDPDITPFWWRLSYSADGTLGKRAPNYPAWNGALHVAGEIAPLRSHALASVRYASRRKSSVSNNRLAGAQYALPAYALFDIHLRTAPFSLFGAESHLAVRVENIFDERFAEGGALGVDIPAVGRSAYLRLRSTY